MTAEETGRWLDDVEARCNAATLGPWEACLKGICACKQVWSIPHDHPVARIESGEWGDHIPAIEERDGERKAVIQLMAYGAISEETGQGNAEFIAHARQDTPELLALARRGLEAEAELQRVQAQAGEMRGVLEDNAAWLKPLLADAPDSLSQRFERIAHALSGDAGKGLLERLERMEKALRKIRGTLYQYHCCRAFRDTFCTICGIINLVDATVAECPESS